VEDEQTIRVVTENEGARRFYESAGWRSDGATKVDDTRGFAIHEVRYGRDVSDASTVRRR